MTTSTHRVRRTVTAFAVAGAVVALVVFLLGALVGLGIVWALLLGVVVGAAAAGALYLRMDQIVLGGIGATPLTADAEPRLANVVDGLCVANGFRTPALYVVDDVAPNMMIVGRDPKHAALAVTTGALERLERIELEGAVAHELSRMRRRDTTLEGAVAVLARVTGAVPALPGRIATAMLDPRASAELDVEGVRLTRYPPGLAGALDQIRRDGREPRLVPVWSRHMWLRPPAGALVPDDFTVEDRIDVLGEL